MSMLWGPGSSRQVRGVALLAVAAVVLSASPALAQFKCKSKIDRKTGAVMVSAGGFAGTLQWSPTSTGTGRDFANQGECATDGSAKRCLLDLVRPEVPPAGCVVYLSGDVGSCATRIKGCTPGRRALPTDGISLRREQSVPFGVFWSRARLLRAVAGARTYGNALRRLDLINGESSAAPTAPSNLREGDDWDIPVATSLRDMASQLRDTVQKEPGLATQVEALWPIGEFWWSRTADSGTSGNQWGVRRLGSGVFSLQSRARALTGRLSVARRIGGSNLRRTAVLRELDQATCCNADGSSCVRWGSSCP